MELEETLFKIIEDTLIRIKDILIMTTTQVVDDVQKGLYIIKSRFWDILPRELQDGWIFAQKDMDAVIKGIPYISPWHLWTTVRRTRLYIRSVIIWGRVDFNHFPVNAYDDPSSPIPMPETISQGTSDDIDIPNNQEGMYDY